MKKIALLLLSVFFNIAFSQTVDIYTGVKKLAAEKKDDEKVKIIAGFYESEINNNPEFCMDLGMKLLKLAQSDKNAITESSAYTILGQGYRLSGNNVKALELHHKAIALAEKKGNNTILAIAENQLANIYKDREEFEKAIKCYRSALIHAEKGKIKSVRSWPLSNLGTVYLAMNKLDSALICAQKSYEIGLENNVSPVTILTYINLGGIHSKMGNGQLARSYYDMAIKLYKVSKSPRYLNFAYTGLADHYKRTKRLDSSAFYAKKAVNIVKNTKFFYLSSKPALLLTNIYEKTNCDSTLKYSKINRIATDSLVSSKTNQQIQLMTFEEDLRQQELAQEKINLEAQNKQTLQYIFIGIGILTLIILYLLLSRSFITNTNLIKFFGVMGLLIVFEFVNLLVHPFLERITHHSPILMLLALVCLAALLVPLHHKVEHWAVAKLIEKNKQIRLANAKKTVEELDENN